LPNLKTFVTLSPIPGLPRTGWRATTRGPIPTDQRSCALAAHYLIAGETRPDGLPLDPVARFHLGNGARGSRVHAGADMSEKGLGNRAA
jgi:malonyl-CoA decarboxylase